VESPHWRSMFVAYCTTEPEDWILLQASISYAKL